MKRRKNAIYTGKSKRVSAITSGDRVLVNDFYNVLNANFDAKDEIEIIPPEQVNPTRDWQEQLFIVGDYCVRKILPEVTGLFRWGDEETLRLRALAPVVDEVTAEAAYDAAGAAATAADTASRNATHDYREAIRVAALAGHSAASANRYASSPYLNAFAGGHVANCVYTALVTCIEADHEAAYNRIIALTNEMLESL